MAEPDLTEFEQLGKRDQRRPCKVGAALEKLDEEPRATLEAALSKPTGEITTGAIEKWLIRRDITTVTLAAITYHRQRRCQCHA